MLQLRTFVVVPSAPSSSRLQSVPGVAMDAVLAIAGGLSVDSVFQLLRHNRGNELDTAGHGLCFMPRIDASTKASVLALLPPTLVLVALAIIGVCYIATHVCRSCCGRFHERGPRRCLETSRWCCVCRKCLGCRLPKSRVDANVGAGAGTRLLPSTNASAFDRASASGAESAAGSSSRCRRLRWWICCRRAWACQRSSLKLHGIGDDSDETAETGVCAHMCCGRAYVRVVDARLDVRYFDGDVTDVTPGVHKPRQTGDVHQSGALGSSASVELPGAVAAGQLEPQRHAGECGVHPLRRRQQRPDSGPSEGRGLVRCGLPSRFNDSETSGGLLACTRSRVAPCDEASGQSVDCRSATPRRVTRAEYIQLHSRPGDNAQRMALCSRVVGLLVVFLQLLYLRTFALVMMMLNCVRLPIDGQHESMWVTPRYRFIDATVRCASLGWQPLALAGVVALVNVAVAVGYYIAMQRASLHREDSSLSTMQCGLRALLSPYKRVYWWWEVALFVQRTLLAALHILNDLPTARAVAAVAVCGMALLLHEKYRPFRSPTSHRIQRCFLAALVLTSLAEMLSALPPAEATREYIAVVSFLNWLAFAVAAVVPLASMLYWYCQRVDITFGITTDELHDAQGRCLPGDDGMSINHCSRA